VPDLLKLATIDLTPLRHRDFRLLFWGQLVTFLGSQVTFVAVPYQVYELTRSPFIVGLLGVAELVPVLVLSMVGGALADARDRRTIVLATEGAFTVTSALLLVNSLAPEPQITIIFLLAAVQAGLFALQRPSLDAMLPRLVDRTELTAAGALAGVRATIGMLLGPAIGGLLIVSLGLPITYGLDVLSFAASLLALALMHAIPPLQDGQHMSLRGILDGLHFARTRPVLIGTYAVDLVAMFFGMPQALFPAIADSMGGASVLGLLYAAPALGAFITLATSGWTTRVRRHGLAVIIAASIWGLGIIGLGLSTEPWMAILALTLAGGADAVSGVFRVTIWNHTVPDALRGRLASIELVSYSSGPALGNTESGLIAGWFGVPVSIVSGGVLCVLGCLVCAVLLPAFRTYDAEQAVSR
jgi:MFS family permease